MGFQIFWVKDNQSIPGRETPANNASILIKTFDERFEIVLADLDDAHLAAGVVGRIGGVGRVDHDGRAKLAADRSGRRLGRVGWPEDLADFSHRVDALVNQNDALFGAGLVAGLAPGLTRRAAGHELDDAVE